MTLRAEEPRTRRLGLGAVALRGVTGGWAGRSGRRCCGFCDASRWSSSRTSSRDGVRPRLARPPSSTALIAPEIGPEWRVETIDRLRTKVGELTLATGFCTRFARLEAGGTPFAARRSKRERRHLGHHERGSV